MNLTGLKLLAAALAVSPALALTPHPPVECADIAGTYACRGGAEVTVSTEMETGNRRPTYGFSFVDKTGNPVATSYVADGMPHLTERDGKPFKYIASCMDQGTIRIIFSTPRATEAEPEKEDNPYVGIRTHRISEEGNFTGELFLGHMEHERPETLKILRRKGVFSCSPK